jgi:hypothetical protein
VIVPAIPNQFRGSPLWAPRVFSTLKADGSAKSVRAKMGQQPRLVRVTRVQRGRDPRKHILLAAVRRRFEVMNCNEFSLLMSAQVDGYAAEREQLDLQQHLRECAWCRRYAADLRGLRADLRALEAPRPTTEPELTLQIQVALEREARAYGNPTRRRQDLIDLWVMRLFSQGVGTVVSLVLFVFVVSAVFKPAYATLQTHLVSMAPVVAMEETGDDPYIRYRLFILQPPPPLTFTPNEDLLRLSQNLPEGAEVLAAVRVNNRNGRAKLDQIVEQSNDPGLADKLSAGLYQKASFHLPRRNEFFSSNAVLIFGKMNVSASLD